MAIPFDVSAVEVGNALRGAKRDVHQEGRGPGLALGLDKKGVVVVASNCMKDGIVHINSGQQYSTATQIPTQEAEAAAQKVAAYFGGEKLKKHEIVPVYGITKENVAQFAAGCSY